MLGPKKPDGSSSSGGSSFSHDSEDMQSSAQEVERLKRANDEMRAGIDAMYKSGIFDFQYDSSCPLSRAVIFDKGDEVVRTLVHCPETLSFALTQNTRRGNSFLYLVARETTMFQTLVNVALEHCPDALATALTQQSSRMSSNPLCEMAENRNWTAFQILIDVALMHAPKVLITVMTQKNYYDQNLLHFTAHNEDMFQRLVKFALEHAPKALVTALNQKSKMGQYPLALAIEHKTINEETLKLVIAALGNNVDRLVGGKKLAADGRELLNAAMPGALEILLDKLIKEDELTEAQYGLCHDKRDFLCDIFLNDDARNDDLNTLENAINSETLLGKVFHKHIVFTIGETDSVKKIKAQIDAVRKGIAQAGVASADGGSRSSVAPAAPSVPLVLPESEREGATERAKHLQRELEGRDPEGDADASLEAWLAEKNTGASTSSSASASRGVMYASDSSSSATASVSSSAAVDEERQEEGASNGAPGFSNTNDSKSRSGS